MTEFSVSHCFDLRTVTTNTAPMGVILDLLLLVKRLEYDHYFIEQSVHRFLKIQSSHHTRSHLHISIPPLSLMKTKQTANVVFEFELRLGVKVRVRID